ncbi:MAG TPA: hypothetical protein VJR27_04895 [Candidatus Saccharimonadales bacterium]|nr:hypothetical protein [Candidatus Saccharimonadales bacterium]
MAFLRFPSKPFSYRTASPEEARFRRVLSAAILEFGEPHDFESGAMTRPLFEDKKGRITELPAPKPTTAREYYMLQEDGNGYAVFGAMRTAYTKTTPVEPVRLAIQFVTVQGTAVIDTAVPSRHAASDSKRDRSYEEKLGPRVRIGVLTRVKGVTLENILMAFAGNKLVPLEDFKPLLALMREQGETKKPEPLTARHFTLLTEFIAKHFGDYSNNLPPDEVTLNFEEIIPETPEEVSQSDGWVRGVASAIKANHEPTVEKRKK